MTTKNPYFLFVPGLNDPRNIRSAIDLADRLKNTLEHIETVEFEVTQSKGPLSDRLLSRCWNIKKLRIHTNKTKPDPIGSYKSHWYYNKYPKLTDIEWNDGVISKRKQLKVLLRKNPNVNHLKFTANIEQALNFLDYAKPTLDVFSIKFRLIDIDQIPSICVRLNQLYIKGRFKRLNITISHPSILINQIENLTSLPVSGMSLRGPYTSIIDRFEQLKELSVDTLVVPPDDVGKLRMLRILRIKEGSIVAIKSFCRYLPNLSEINIHNLRPETVDAFNSLINVRENLRFANYLKLHLPDWAYFSFKRLSAFTNRIGVYRVESSEPSF